jgi:hypothetical protein
MYHDRGGMVTTLIGHALMMLCLLMLGYTNLRSIKRFLVLDDFSNKEYVAFLEQTKRNQIYYYRRTQVAGMLCYSVAILFYLFEPVQKNIWLAVALYGFVIAAVLVLWLIIRPGMYKRESRKLQIMINHAERLAQQLQENEKL